VQPRCDVEVEDSVYQPGETVRFSTIRFANDGDTEAPVRLRLQLDVPGVGNASVLDVPVTMPPHFDRDVGPVDAFVVSAAQPDGSYKLRCTIEESNGFLIYSDEAVFAIAPSP
jgi:hypothetical protein